MQLGAKEGAVKKTGKLKITELHNVVRICHQKERLSFPPADAIMEFKERPEERKEICSWSAAAVKISK